MTFIITREMQFKGLHNESQVGRHGAHRLKLYIKHGIYTALEYLVCYALNMIMINNNESGLGLSYYFQ